MSEFKKRLLRLVSEIPEGKVSTYKSLATAMGNPEASRAVGNALSKNPRPIEVPCHRVVRSDGSLGGYRLGRDKKLKLLREEGIDVEGGEIDLKKYLFEDFE